MRKYFDGLPPRLNRLARMFVTSADMAIVALGIFFQLEADLGLSPWNALDQGISRTVGMSFGTVHNIVSVSIMVLDIILHQKIGYGTIVVSVLVGIFTDIFSECIVLPEMTSLAVRLVVFILGIGLVALGQGLYMRMGLCCGPRDSLNVAMSKSVKKLSIGTVNNIIYVVVLGVSYLLGATIGVGTVISVFGCGFILDAVVKALKYQPKEVEHENIFETVRVLVSGTSQTGGKSVG